MTLLDRIFGRQKNRTGDYHVYTRRYDREVSALELKDVLGELDAQSSTALSESWAEYQRGFDGLKTKVGFHAMDVGTSFVNTLSEDQIADTLVCILIDQSGSMRGQKMLMTAMTVDILQANLAGIGMRVEVLGFTTIGWHGGNSRKQWRRLGRKRNPGRLCDLLHVIYKDAGDHRASTEGWQFREMLRPDLPRENVDGEALEWAASRMRARPEKSKILLVVSDGAPVDDSTLDANSADYLANHLRCIISGLEKDADIAVCALGLGFDVERYYRNSAQVSVPQQIPEALFAILRRGFERDAIAPVSSL